MADQRSTAPAAAPQKQQAMATAEKPRDWHPFESLRREVDRLFDDFDRHSPFRRNAFESEPFWRRDWLTAATPASEIVEHDGNYEITVELPGMDEKNVDVQVANGLLTITGEKKEESENTKKRLHVSERRYGYFERAFRLPDGVDADKIEARFKNGVLTLNLPKSAEAKREKKIPIKAAS
ncbi:Hsp20/alpha crystallin family protein [Solimonas variicoloris]|uniref:Hsp20/alpha crystallin family protein n=1 Tax=Solimonas variicoloris TaxID=254408 RepID=UPI000373F061|nr:Hsp20/alpha crystallin family protein [Solimonas variicoloris]